MTHLRRFLLLWASTAIALWIVDGGFDSITFLSLESLAMASVVLALANLTIKPLLVVLTLPFTILTLGLALPVINGLVLLGVAAVVPGFEIAGFWMGVLAALAVSLVSLLIRVATGQTRVQTKVIRGRVDQDEVIDVEAREKRDPTSRRHLKDEDED
jgi:putative membrane protein